MRRQVLAGAMACLCVAAAHAQTVDTPLSEAKLLLNAAIAHFSREAYGAESVLERRDDAEYFKKMRDATAIFLRGAQGTAAADALDAVQTTFTGRLLVAPPTLAAAIDECERRRDPQLTALVASNVADFVGNAPAPPVVDNPGLYGSVTPPRTAADLLRNLKFALEHGALLRDDFYAAGNLKRFFGSAGELHREPDGEISVIWTDGKCRYAAGKRHKESGQASGGLRLSCTDGATAAEIAKVFGKPAQSGADRLHYDFSDLKIGRSVDFFLDARGLTQALDLSEEEAPVVK